jgi:hypothetical protein
MNHLRVRSRVVGPGTSWRIRGLRDTALSVMFRVLAVMLSVTLIQFLQSQPIHAAGASTSVHLVKCGSDGALLAERTVDYKWMERNLSVQGDGVTHYYHQGPVFEGDIWDPDESANLKDKGAVKGTDVMELCELVGGMSPGDEIMLKSVDGWSTRLAYSNIYEPYDRQGPVVLCWYKGRDLGDEDKHGSGYPANDAYSEAIQIVLMVRTTNAEGKHVFGNSDMQVCLSEEEYQHFYEGLPSTNGLSGKWIDTVIIYPVGSTPNVPDGDTHAAPAEASSSRIPWLSIGLGGAGLLMVGVAVYLITRGRDEPSYPKGEV